MVSPWKRILGRKGILIGLENVQVAWFVLLIFLFI